jgi:uncharacterized membrane protein
MDWNRAELKTRAKGDLSGSYWYAFLVSFIIVLTGGSYHWGGGGSAGGTSGAGHYEFSLLMGILILMGVVIAIAVRVFIGYAIEIGGRKFFIQLTKNERSLGYFGYGFQRNRYYRIVVTMLLRGIYLILWTLLLIIPGIIKMYAYRMVPYILADNPNIGHSRAIELSNQMTMGEKFDIFVLDLSFLGWYLLGALALGVGVLFVQPYYDATNAELYLELREKAIKKGIISPGELKL